MAPGPSPPQQPEQGQMTRRTRGRISQLWALGTEPQQRTAQPGKPARAPGQSPAPGTAIDRTHSQLCGVCPLVRLPEPRDYAPTACVADHSAGDPRPAAPTRAAASSAASNAPSPGSSSGAPSPTRYDKLAILYGAVAHALGAPAAADHAADPGCTGTSPPRRLRLCAVDHIDLVVPPGGMADGVPPRADPSAGALGSFRECAHSRTVVPVALTGIGLSRVS